MSKPAKFMAIARAVAALSKDQSTQVGALVLGPDWESIAFGYNGFPRGMPDDDPVLHRRPDKYFVTEHAERNAIYAAARIGAPVKGARMVVTMFPCADCARAIIQAGIVELIAPKPDIDCPRWGESFKHAVYMLGFAGISITWEPGTVSQEGVAA